MGERSFGERMIVKTGDITHTRVGAIVNAANSSLMGGGGVDGAIHRAGGRRIKAACQALRDGAYPDGLPAGEAVITTGGDLAATYVIHTAGPVWGGGTHGEPETLASCYRNSLRLAVENGVRTVAFPAISTGVYGYPTDQAARVASRVVAEFLAEDDTLERVAFVLFGEDAFETFVANAEA